MKITMLSKADFCGSGKKTVDAIRRHTDHDIEVYSKRHIHRLGHPFGVKITSENFYSIQDRIDSSDIIHIKGDWPPVNGYLGFELGKKPVVVSVSGGYFRKKIHTGVEKFNPTQYDCTLKTAYTPDLCYPDYSDIWTPHPIDSDNQVIEWSRQEPPLFIHSRVSVSKGGKKGTSFIMEVFDEIARTRKIETEFITNVTFQEVVEARKRATIFFDQFGVGFYGNSAVEAMQYGIPTCAWISPWALEQAKGADDLDGCPVITLPEKNVDAWAAKIIEVLDGDMNDLAKRTKQWCDEVHGYQAIALQWDKLYQDIA